MIDPNLLRRLRNDLPMPALITALGPTEGYFRFLCPHCGEISCTVNPRNNLAHCFTCKKNLNTIDLLITEGHDFLSAVALLKRWLDDYEARQSQKSPTTPPAKPTQQSPPPNP